MAESPNYKIQNLHGRRRQYPVDIKKDRAADNVDTAASSLTLPGVLNSSDAPPQNTATGGLFRNLSAPFNAPNFSSPTASRLMAMAAGKSPLRSRSPTSGTPSSHGGDSAIKPPLFAVNDVVRTSGLRRTKSPESSSITLGKSTSFGTRICSPVSPIGAPAYPLDFGGSATTTAAMSGTNQAMGRKSLAGSGSVAAAYRVRAPGRSPSSTDKFGTQAICPPQSTLVNGSRSGSQQRNALVPQRWANDAARLSNMPAGFVRSRRTAISSEPVSVQSMLDWKPPVFPKTEEEASRIEKIITEKLVVLFGQLSSENRKSVVRAMFKKTVPAGEVIIKQNDDGDNFYIIDSGRFDILVQRLGKPKPEKVMEATAGMSFGELALMYNAPRAATCVATEDAVVWALDRQSFRMLLVSSESMKKRRYESLLEKIEIFKCLTKLEICQLSDILTCLECKRGDCVIRQGDRGDKFFLVENGELVCKMRQQSDSKEIEVHRYKRGGYFGELALITDYGVRKASVYAEQDGTRLLWIGKSTFDRVLGPIIDVLRKNADKYPTYVQLLEKRSR